MALGFSVNVYGTANAEPPYKGDVSGNAGFIQATFPAAQIVALSNFPTTPVNIWPISPGVLMNGTWCYGVIEVPAGGLQLYSEKYIVKELTSTLATLRG